MKFSRIFFFFILLISSQAFSQKIIFVKYKASVPSSEVKSRLDASIKSIIATDAPSKDSKITIAPFAKGLADRIPELSRIVAVRISDEPLAQSVANALKENFEIEYVQEGLTYKIDYIPNDSLVNQQWALSKIGAFESWAITEGADTVIVSVIDTGIDYKHPDLKNKVFINQGETGKDQQGRDKNSNGIDDDNNGFVDDYMGWDFTDRTGFPFDTTGGDYLDWDNDPMDENLYSHGTAVAGIIGAETNNSLGIAGVAPRIKILNLRSFDPQGYGEEDDVSAAVLYSVLMGAKVINMSFGDYSYSHVLRDVVRYAYSKNVVLVGSSGNSNSPDPHYPSGYSEVISVGNSTAEDYVAGSSNYGSTLDLVAPGTQIKTTSRNWNYTDFNGTSAAAPFVTASAAMILSKKSFSNEEVKQILKSTADDIGNPGWDIRAGAGRLNLLRALKVLAPSVIKFNFPLQDYSTSLDTLKINATILSSYFKSFSLEYGTGLNPVSWTNLISNQQNQVSDQIIYNFALKSLKDSVYTLRLKVEQTNSFTAEERVNFRIKRSGTKGELISLLPAYYGDKPTFMAATYTEDPAVVKMYYKRSSESVFSYVTLDGFSTNTGFVKQLHYGFIPRSQIFPSEQYDIYFEVTNEGGFKTEIRDTVDRYFTLNSGDLFRTYEKTQKTFTLPAGYIFDKSIALPGNNKGALIREVMSPETTKLYRFENEKFVTLETDTLNRKIAKDYGDFNKDGVTDLLSLWGYSAHIHKQVNNTGTFQLATSADTSYFWPIGVFDLDRDNKNELLAVRNDTTVVVYSINSDLSLTYKSRFYNQSGMGFGGNTFNSPFLVVKDIDGDSKNEIVFTDSDGDIVVMKVNAINDIKTDKIIRTGYMSSSSFIASGDFNSDGKEDLAVLLQAVPDVDVAPYNRIIIFNFAGTNLNISYDNAFIDPAVEFKSTFQRASNSLKFYDIDSDGKQELLLFTYPYAYIIKSQGLSGEIVSYDENVNTNAILIEDFDGNGIAEIAYPYGNIIKFFEFNQTASFAPTLTSAFSVDNSKIRISFQGSASKYFVYRGLTESELVLYDSTTSQFFNDTGVELNKNYYYKVEGVSGTRKAASKVIKVFHHSPAKYSSASVKTLNSVEVLFSNKMRKEIDNPSGIHLIKGNEKIPLSSYTPSGENAFLLTFSSNFNNGPNRVLISGLIDNYGSPVSSDTATFTYTPGVVTESFFIESFKILDNYTVSIRMNLDLDPATAGDVSNYSFSPDNKVTSATVSPTDKKTVILSLKGSKPVGSLGREYTLTLKNIRSDAGSGNLLINSNSGATIVLTATASSLEDIYTFPSPVDKSKHRSVTFANLPRYVDIIIFNLEGVRIAEFSENDGNGGVDWNLLDSDGREVPSGVYIYRATMTDGKKNELGTKTGKIAIIR
ncbi:MAG: S8 family serine peptidase [Ignavibacteria bacterium]|nr:S8 family serine peptidase [Ignavibacteria bacterium]